MKQINYLLFITLLSLTGCGDTNPTVYSYQEKVIDSPLAAMEENTSMQKMADMIPPPSLAGSVEWTIPDQWEELPGSGFRLATFKLKNNPEAIETTIIKLGGPAGGALANIERWMGQIGLQTLGTEEMDKFIQGLETFTTRSGEKGYYVDLSVLQTNADPAEKTILASIIETEQETLFVKMQGAIQDINNNKEAFKALNTSIQILKDE